MSKPRKSWLTLEIDGRTYEVFRATLCYILYAVKENEKGEERREVVGYYGNIATLAPALAEHELRVADEMQSIQDAVDLVARIGRELDRLIRPLEGVSA